MAGVTIPGYTDPNYTAQLQKQQAAEAAAAARAGTNAGTAQGNADKAQWQIAHPGMQYGAPTAMDQIHQQAAMNALNGTMPGGISSLFSMSGGLFPGGSGTSIPSIASFTNSGAYTPPATLTPPDTSGAQANAFARSKDQVGLTSRGALTGLAGAMAGRGIVGSGVEGRAQAGVINAGQQQLGEVSRDQAITSADLAQKNAETAYQGGITQRGQDISNNASLRGDVLTERGQDLNVQQQNANRALQALMAQQQNLRSLY